MDKKNKSDSVLIKGEIMKKNYDLAIVFGRFQILHLGHCELLKKAFEVADKVIVFIGSMNKPRTIVDPFIGQERTTLVRQYIYNNLIDSSEEFDILGIYDYLSNAKWAKQISSKVDSSKKVCIVGSCKNEGYEKFFPAFDHVLPDDIIDINATDIRSNFYSGIIDYDLIPKETIHFLECFKQTNLYNHLVGENNCIRELNKAYGKGPFLTCDNVIVQDGRVLLVKRKNHPGKGLWAIPGGYLDVNESLKEGAYRELLEETNASITWEQFNRFLKGQEIFDNPKRSVACRIVTSAYYIQLPNWIECKINAADDAAEARWFTFNEVASMANVMYDDHFHIAHYFIGD